MGVAINKKVAHLLGYHVTNAARYMLRTLQRNFNKSGYSVTSEQWLVLVSLFDKDGLTQNELCDATSKDKPGITRILKNMERNNLVSRMGDPTDGRSKRIFLTKEARKMEKHLLEIAERTVSEATKAISEKDIAHCRAVLNKIVDNLS
jgi:DNA-binding MarR family transcriptional regulator